MENEIKIGLTIGKFAPLHKGHQFLIETALEQVDRLIVMIYDCPDITDIPLKIRANWIRKLYSEVIIIEAYNSPKQIGKDEESIRIQIDYIKNKVLDYKITHFFSSEWYGEYVSESLGVKNIIVDAERKKFPISGTMARSDLIKHKEYFDAVVYRDIVKK
ncbi:MAG: adenylyltransferase/cytidyltransferase family protein [Patescibacteria group bacterium]|nr:adenylyltransferase/cytidyltransferase family protein [Patescibacteria group bacterium]